MDIQKKVEQVVKKLLKEDDLMEKFEKNPAAVIEDVLGVDIPNEPVNEIVDLVKAKLTAEKVGDALEALGGLFQKK